MAVRMMGPENRTFGSEEAMHLVCDARCIHSHRGGIGVMAEALIRRFSINPAEAKITALITPNRPDNLAFGNTEMAEVDAAMIDERFEQLVLPGILDDLKADVYLNFTFSVPAIRTCAQIAVIHDVVFEDNPEWVEPSLRNYLATWSRVSAAVADHVITVSDHAMARIRSRYQVPADRVTRIYNAVPDLAQNHGPEARQADISRIVGASRYILCLGTLEEKKGTNELLRAFHELGKCLSDVVLVFAGAEGGSFSAREAIAKAKVEERTRFLGYVDEDIKHALLKNASVVAYPSKYEGFGLPPLEAMRYGVPCVANAGTSLPEVLGGAAILVDVTDPRAFSSTLVRALNDEDLRRTAVSEGPRRASGFSWDRSAGQYLSVCKAVYAKSIEAR